MASGRVLVAWKWVMIAEGKQQTILLGALRGPWGATLVHLPLPIERRLYKLGNEGVAVYLGCLGCVWALWAAWKRGEAKLANWKARHHAPRPGRATGQTGAGGVFFGDILAGRQAERTDDGLCDRLPSRASAVGWGRTRMEHSICGGGATGTGGESRNKKKCGEMGKRRKGVLPSPPLPTGSLALAVCGRQSVQGAHYLPLAPKAPPTCTRDLIHLIPSVVPNRDIGMK